MPEQTPGTVPVRSRIAGPNPCVRTFPIPGPSDPQRPPAEDPFGYVFPTWRAALGEAHGRIAAAYDYRARLFRKAHEAGLSYREIGEATGLSAAAVGKILGKQGKATLDSSVHEVRDA